MVGEPSNNGWFPINPFEWKMVLCKARHGGFHPTIRQGNCFTSVDIVPADVVQPLIDAAELGMTKDTQPNEVVTSHRAMSADCAMPVEQVGPQGREGNQGMELTVARGGGRSVCKL